MRWSRRRVLWVGLAAAGAAGSWGISRTTAPAPFGRADAVADLPDADPAALSDAAAASLVAAAETVIGVPIEPAHYAEYFRWRAEHLRGYQAVYAAFARDVDRSARAASGRTFAESPAAVRRAVLAAARRAGEPEDVWDGVRAAIGGSPWPRYNQFILDEALALFARTDAWIALGYRGWPGEPRGLDRYRRAPA